MYNDWFMNFAPDAFRTTRIQTTKDVEATLKATDNLADIRPEILREHPEVLPTMRMSTCPPIAVDRLVGLAKVSKSMVMRIEKEQKLPVRMSDARLDEELTKIGDIIQKMADPDIFVWLGRTEPATETEIHRATPSSRTGFAAPSPIRSFAMRRRSASWQPWPHGLRRATTDKSKLASVRSSMK